MYFTKPDLGADAIQWDLSRAGKGFSCWVSSLFYKRYLCHLDSGVRGEGSKARLCTRLVMVFVVSGPGCCGLCVKRGCQRPWRPTEPISGMTPWLGSSMHLSQ